MVRSSTLSLDTVKARKQCACELRPCALHTMRVSCTRCACVTIIAGQHLWAAHHHDSWQSWTRLVSACKHHQIAAFQQPTAVSQLPARRTGTADWHSAKQLRGSVSAGSLGWGSCAQSASRS